LSSSWHSIAPDVYVCDHFLTSAGTALLQQFMDRAMDHSGIPRRRPNGMNRFGGVFHPSSRDTGGVDGAIALQAWDVFYADLMQQYIRLLGRKFFSSYIRSDHDDAESYAFTIRYKVGEDVQLQEHTDASLYTININLNTVTEATTTTTTPSYDGSKVYFVTEPVVTSNGTVVVPRNKTTIAFAPGSAVLHRGQIRHGALPLTHGERTNLVIWVFGEQGYVRIQPYGDESRSCSSNELLSIWNQNEL
jgi:hypothetical protein